MTDLLPQRDSLSTDTTLLETANRGNTAMEETAKQHYVIADNLHLKGFYQDAVDEALKAYHIQEPLLGSDSIDLAKTCYLLGLSYRAIREFGPSVHHLTKACQIYQAQPVEESKKGSHPYRAQINDCKLNIARSHHAAGVKLQREADYDKSILEHRKALSIREHLLGKSHLETARSYYVLGCAMSDRGDFDEALGELRRALRVRLLIFGPQHLDTKEVVTNLGIVLRAKNTMLEENVQKYMQVVLQALELERQGDRYCRLEDDLANGLVCYRKALSLEEEYLGELHPTTTDLYLKTAETLSSMNEIEASLMEYKQVILIRERSLGKYHVSVAKLYCTLAGILMTKGEYETALSFYAKAYGIFDTVLGNHEDTKQTMMNLRLAAAKERTAKESMDLIKKAEVEFQEYQRQQKELEKELLEKETAFIKLGEQLQSPIRDEKKKIVAPVLTPEPPVEEVDVI